MLKDPPIGKEISEGGEGGKEVLRDPPKSQRGEGEIGREIRGKMSEEQGGRRERQRGGERKGRSLGPAKK
jgi:hypothetical protein